MEKKALGKGLAALLPESEARETGQTIHMIPVAQIVPNRNQPRKTFVEEELRELVESVKQHGILQPVLVRRKVKIVMNSLRGRGGSARPNRRTCRLSPL